MNPDNPSWRCYQVLVWKVFPLHDIKTETIVSWGLVQEYRCKQFIGFHNHGKDPFQETLDPSRAFFGC